MLVPDSAADPAAVVDGAAGFGQIIIAGGDDSAFAGGEIFARLKGEGAQIADGAGGAVVVARAMGVGGVFDDSQLVLLGDRHDRIHVGDLAGEMDGNDGAGATCDSGLDGARIDVEGFNVDVREDGDGVGFDDGGGGREKGVGRDDHLILGADSGGQQRYAQGNGAVDDAD